MWLLLPVRCCSPKIRDAIAMKLPDLCGKPEVPSCPIHDSTTAPEYTLISSMLRSQRPALSDCVASVRPRAWSTMLSMAPGVWCASGRKSRSLSSHKRHTVLALQASPAIPSINTNGNDRTIQKQTLKGSRHQKVFTEHDIS